MVAKKNSHQAYANIASGLCYMLEINLLKSDVSYQDWVWNEIIGIFANLWHNPDVGYWKDLFCDPDI